MTGVQTCALPIWEEEKGGERKCWTLATGIPNFLCPILLPEYECVECPKWKEKKNWQTNYGNTIAEIGGKKICNNCGNGIAENGGGGKIVVSKSGESKKKVLHSQYFHNKSHVISYY